MIMLVRPEVRELSTVKFVYDLAGRSPDNIASHSYRVTGIPTTYIIDRNGNVADAIVGFDPGSTEIETALARQNIKLK